MQVYSSRFPSRKPKTERWGQWISSQQCCNNRLLLLPLIRVLPGQNEIVQNLDESGYYKYTAREGLENVCSYVTLIGSWQSKHPKLNQEELPASIQCTGVRQTNNGCVQAYFFLPSPSLFSILTCQPLPWNHFLTRSNSRLVWTSKSIAL